MMLGCGEKKTAVIKLDACGETSNCNLAQTNARFQLFMPYLFDDAIEVGMLTDLFSTVY